MKTILDLIQKADAVMENGQYDEAEPLLLVALKHDTKNPEIYFMLGEVYCKQRRFKESIDMLRRADALLPHHPRIYHLLGWALFMNGNITDGRFYMTKALKNEPDDIQLLCDLAVLEMRAMDFLKAREYVGVAMTLSPDNEMVQEVTAVISRADELQKFLLRKN